MKQYIKDDVKGIFASKKTPNIFNKFQILIFGFICFFAISMQADAKCQPNPPQQNNQKITCDNDPDGYDTGNVFKGLEITVKDGAVIGGNNNWDAFNMNSDNALIVGKAILMGKTSGIRLNDKNNILLKKSSIIFNSSAGIIFDGKNGSKGNVVNINGKITDVGHGVYFSKGESTNNLIQIGLTGEIYANENGFKFIFPTNKNEFINHGIIFSLGHGFHFGSNNNNENFIRNFGVIKSNNAAVLLNGHKNFLYNNGLIVATNDIDGDAINMGEYNKYNTIINDVEGIIESTQEDGLELTGQYFTLHNLGQIKADGFGIHLGGLGKKDATTIYNGKTGKISSGNSAIYAGGSFDIQVSNAGIIETGKTGILLEMSHRAIVENSGLIKTHGSGIKLKFSDNISVFNYGEINSGKNGITINESLNSTLLQSVDGKIIAHGEIGVGIVDSENLIVKMLETSIFKNGQFGAGLYIENTTNVDIFLNHSMIYTTQGGFGITVEDNKHISNPIISLMNTDLIIGDTDNNINAVGIATDGKAKVSLTHSLIDVGSDAGSEGVSVSGDSLVSLVDSKILVHKSNGIGISASLSNNKIFIDSESTVFAKNQDGYAVHVHGTENKINNHGLIDGYLVGVDFISAVGQYNVLQNGVSGKIHHTADHGIAVQDGTGHLALHNEGLVEGFSLGEGNDRYVHFATATLQGIGDGGNGDGNIDEVVFIEHPMLNNVEGHFNFSQLSNFETAKIESGIFEFTGIADVNEFVVDGGTLKVFDHDSGVGDFTVKGDFLVDGDGTVNLSLVSDQPYSNTKILIGGDAWLDGTLKVDILGNQTITSLQETFILISAVGGLHDRFVKEILPSDNSLFIDMSIDYTANEVLVNYTRTPYEKALLLYPNRHNIAENLTENLLAGAKDDMAVVLSTLDYLDVAEFRSALDDLSPEAYGVSNDVSLSASELISDRVSNHLSALQSRCYQNIEKSCTDAFRLWVDYIPWSESNRQSSREHTGYRIETEKGVIVAFDGRLATHFDLGLAINYIDSKGVIDENHSGKSRSHQFGMTTYGRFHLSDKGDFIEVQAGYFRVTHETTRHIRFLNREVESDGYQQNIFTGGLRYGRRVSFGNVKIEPSIGFKSAYIDNERQINEQGGDAIDLVVSMEDIWHNKVDAKISAEGEIVTDFGKIIPSTHLGYGYVIKGETSDIRAEFAGNAETVESFVIQEERAQEEITMGVGIGFELNNGLLFSVDYEHGDGDGAVSDKLVGRASFSF